MYMHVDFRNVKLRLSECAVILLVEIGSVGITFTTIYCSLYVLMGHATRKGCIQIGNEIR